MIPLNIDIHLLVITSFFIYGLQYVCDANNKTPMSWVGILAARYYWHPNIVQPLFGCVYCMPSVWWTTIYLLFSTPLNFQTWLVGLVAVIGLNRLLKSFT